MIEVIAPGPLATVQDLGRPGYAEVGVGRSGAADLLSHRLGNRLVGNAEHAATVEVTFGGLRIRVRADLLIAVTGAPAPVFVQSVQYGGNAPLRVPAGVELRLGTPQAGLRSYLAVRGGIACEPVLGSRSTDLLSGLGPAPLRAGDTLAVGEDSDAAPIVDVAPVPGYQDEPVLRIRPGPRRDWFTPEAWAMLLDSPYTVTPDGNRIGVRLSGPPLGRAVQAELPSEPLVLGAIQVPANGQPLVFLADHPVTGGYPVIGVVCRADVGRAAQLRPGQRVRFAASPDAGR
jgi:biotin-dependent carboxylase-like uncharacterized protein